MMVKKVGFSRSMMLFSDILEFTYSKSSEMSLKKRLEWLN